MHIGTDVSAGLVVSLTETLSFFFLDDHSRVHLTPVEGVPDSDYINASFINVRNSRFSHYYLE